MSNTLTDKQESFAQSIADGLSQADAYRANYNTSRMTDKSIWEKASELAKNVKVSARVAELRQALADKQLWTRADSVKVLCDITEDTEAPHAAKVSAVKELNSMHGFNEPAKVNVNVVDRTELLRRAEDEVRGIFGRGSARGSERSDGRGLPH